ncbi:MAG TPA: hypothetical protein VFU55_13660 [Terracidiphilus sp.]|nr:hypothetical protein [Terracidiphilus sp.]
MKWNHWIRQTHRWLSVAFMVTVLLNAIAVFRGHYSRTLGLVAVVPLAFLFFTGVYLFMLPYAVRWRRVRRAG